MSEFVETRTKVHRLNEGYTHIPKRRDFTEDPNEEILGNQRFWAREACYLCYCASRGRDLLTKLYIHDCQRLSKVPSNDAKNLLRPNDVYMKIWPRE